MKIEEISQHTNMLANAADAAGKTKDDTQRADEKAGGRGGEGTTRVDISTASQEFRKAAEAMEAETPERVERVNRIKEAVQSGQYHVDARKVAEKVIRESLLDILGH